MHDDNIGSLLRQIITHSKVVSKLRAALFAGAVGALLLGFSGLVKIDDASSRLQEVTLKSMSEIIESEPHGGIRATQEAWLRCVTAPSRSGQLIALPGRPLPAWEHVVSCKDWAAEQHAARIGGRDIALASIDNLRERAQNQIEGQREAIVVEMQSAVAQMQGSATFAVISILLWTLATTLLGPSNRSRTPHKETNP